MARLRSGPAEPSAPMLPPPSTTKTTKTTRASPRKTIRESPSKRELRYTLELESQDHEDSFLVPKIPAAAGENGTATPKRKQKVLRPIASNSRLLTKLSDESIRTPDRKVRKERVGGTADKRGLGLGYLYSKGMGRGVVSRESLEVGSKKLEIKPKVQEIGEGTMAFKAVQMKEVVVESVENEQEMEEKDENEEAETSLWCGDEEDVEIEEKQEATIEEEIERSDEDEDEEPVVIPRQRLQARTIPTRPGPQHREHESEPASQRKNRKVEEEASSSDEDEDPVVVRIRKRQPETQMMTLVSRPIEVAHAQEQAICGELPPLQSARSPHRKGKSTISNWAQEVIDLTSSPSAPPPSLSAHSRAQSTSTSRPTSSSSADVDAVLTYSPTPKKCRSPRKVAPSSPSRPCTPPALPERPTKLKSPSKKTPRVPQLHGLRPSLDAFWDPEVVNDWNDKHSPSKPLFSPRKQKLLKILEKQDKGLSLSDSDDSLSSPTASPQKKKATNPVKKGPYTNSPTVAEVRTQRKAFATQKHAIAEAFLKELDDTITAGRVTEMSKATGGIKLIWSKTLKTTAGRANWRREQIRIQAGPSPTDIRTEYRHNCSIELAEKVIDDEHRLYNVLAHEFCHLTTFMISGIRNNPHGAEFKSWGRKVGLAFADKDVEVTTKHSYQIDFKFVWECVGCGYEYKRHSKSVDPVKHTCGRCKTGRLVQTKPTPRSGGKDGKPKEKGEYQVFIKAHFGRVKTEMKERGEDTQMGKVMEAVAREYRERKKGVEIDVGDIGLALEGLKLGD
ncbi:hypothetical protein P154DRAFT_620235 [Amniculicola lignicola CBS 123094]|uniref:POU-specific domain-containing protein n=1 Tax=Amniculicola lignicola CBS 123094 TaxID=1392246 RepID=A0A6A5WFL8_9PLEO|nr:hypothetical protein P154DRAFT_620235 [Amniculicola lignicola CBS 123094]